MDLDTIDVKKNSIHSGKFKVLLISATTVLLIGLFSCIYILHSVLAYDKIFSGITINGINVGNLTKEEAIILLNGKFMDNLLTSTIRLSCNKYYKEINFFDMNVSYNVNETVNNAYMIGRTGNIFEKISDIYYPSNPKKQLKLIASFDKEKVSSIIDSLYKNTLLTVKQPFLIFENKKVAVNSGYTGENIDKNWVFEKVANLINNFIVEDLEIPIIKTPKNKIDLENFYNQINIQVQDAHAVVENNVVKIIPEVVGRQIDKTELSNILSSLENTENKEVLLPVTFTEPRAKTNFVQNNIFRDTLSIIHTQFYTSTENDANRGVNIGIAASKINGILLSPNEVFSFNKLVGPRNLANGYKTAHVYSDGRVTDGTGGGICQVSSTLYNAVLFSNLETIERTNHMFTVGYVPFGRDAAVSYGSVDFKFKNSTAWPIKIEMWVTPNNQLFCSITGTNETPDRTVDIKHVQIKTLQPVIKYLDEPTWDVNKTKILEYGKQGCIIDTYKIIKSNGVIISEKKLHTSVYNAIDKEIKRGTKKKV